MDSYVILDDELTSENIFITRRDSIEYILTYILQVNKLKWFIIFIKLS